MELKTRDLQALIMIKSIILKLNTYKLCNLLGFN